MIRVAVVPVTPFAQNCSVFRCDATGKGAIVDPGGEIDRLLAVAEEIEADVEKILVTHAHVDHAGAVGEIAERLGVPVEGPHPDDTFWIERLPADAEKYGFPPSRAFVPDRWLDQGDVVTVGEQTLSVHHCPGHTPGHVVLFHDERRLAFVGDVLFKGSIGRSDFPRGDHDTLIASIRERLWPLGDDVQFIPGHGPMSTFGEERASNPFVADRLFDE